MPFNFPKLMSTHMGHQDNILSNYFTIAKYYYKILHYKIWRVTTIRLITKRVVERYSFIEILKIRWTLNLDKSYLIIFPYNTYLIRKFLQTPHNTSLISLFKFAHQNPTSTIIDTAHILETLLSPLLVEFRRHFIQWLKAGNIC